MRGNTALVLVLVGLVLPAAVLTVQGQAFVQFGPGVVVQNGLIAPPGPPGNSPALEPATGDLLEFTDGSAIHGELKRMDPASGLRWENPAAKNPIDLKPGHIDSIRFAHPGSVTVAPTARLRLANGDDLFGSVTSLDDNHLGFSTWFGGALTIPRPAVQSISFLSSNYTILYEGPFDADGWIIGNRNPESWTYRDGTFTGESPGTLGRDFKLTDSSTIEFDLGWKDAFLLLVCIYSDAANHFEDYGNTYMIEFRHDQNIAHNQVNLRSLTFHGAAQIRTLGSAPLTLPAGKNKVHITIQSNKEEGTVAVFVDNVLIKRWKDENGFSAPGGALLFQQASMTSASVNLSNFKISQWEGRYEPEISTVATNVDVVRFINHDQTTGKIAGITGGKITLAVGGIPLQIPLMRVTQINFAATPIAAATNGPWDVRAHFPHGGSLSFQLEKWGEKEVSGRSAIFGPLAFRPGQIRRLDFNIDRTSAPVPVGSGGEFEDLDTPVPPASSPAHNPSPDGLLFRNGDVLRGQLLAIDAPGAVRWQHPDAAGPTEFKPGGIAQIDFPTPKNSAAYSNNACRLLLANGDLLEGSFLGCDRANLVLQTWYAGRLNIPRSSLQSLAFIPHSPEVFEAITGLDGWTQGTAGAAFPGESSQWIYRNGAFYADKPASIARDFKLPDVAEIQFDLAWKGSLNFAVALYTDSLQPIRLPITELSPDFAGFYSLRFDDAVYKDIDLWPIKKKDSFRSLGPVGFPYLNNKDRLHVDLRVNKPQSKIALFLNDMMIKEWFDPKGFAGEGTGMRFVQNPGGIIKLSNLHITKWVGLFTDEPSAEDDVAPTEIAHDAFWPENGAKVPGDIESIANGKMTVHTALGPMQIPLTEIKAIDFAHRQPGALQTQAGTVRATFAQGGSLTFILESWRPNEMIIRSADFGKTSINPAAFTRLQFLFPEKKAPEKRVGNGFE